MSDDHKESRSTLAKKAGEFIVFTRTVEAAADLVLNRIQDRLEAFPVRHSADNDFILMPPRDAEIIGLAADDLLKRFEELSALAQDIYLMADAENIAKETVQ